VVTIKIRFAKEVIPYALVLLILVVGIGYFLPYVALIPLALLIFVLFFFRNPVRNIVPNSLHILSPADGKVMAITEYDDQEFFHTRVKKVTIFLSVLNVHINRSPISGKVVYVKYTEGKFLPAYKEEAGLVNEKNTIGIENDQLKILVHQIAGILARRVVCRSKVGDALEQGEAFGLIKFGSCTEVIFPSNVQVNVQKNDKVKAGITVIGTLK
jgi:phosphatidylserine decarboxylase